MKKHILFRFLPFSLILSLTLTLFSCRYTDSFVTDDENKVKDTVDNAIVGDKDKDGCTAAAGYIWSKINKECVKMFSGLQLNPSENQENEDDTLSAYILFSEDASQAELFMPNADQSILLKETEKGKIWNNDEWKLVKDNGFQLVRDNAIIFKGDSEIGKKFTQTDNQE